MIVRPFSRLFCYVERIKNDKDEIMSKVGMDSNNFDLMFMKKSVTKVNTLPMT